MGLNALAEKAYDNAKEKGLLDGKQYEHHIMGIIGEVCEAEEALFKNRRSTELSVFEKDTFEDELADIHLRTLTLCHYYGVDVNSLYENNSGISYTAATNTTQMLVILAENVAKCFAGSNDVQWRHQKIVAILKGVMTIAQKESIPLMKHVSMKMKYNKTRPFLHRV